MCDTRLSSAGSCPLRATRRSSNRPILLAQKPLLAGGGASNAKFHREGAKWARASTLTDVVVWTLSPGINDPFTAINGIDELASGVSQLARRPRVAEKRHDETGALRLIVPRPQIAEVLEDTVGHISIYAAADRFVMAGLHRVLDVVGPDLRGDQELSALATLRGELGRQAEASTGSHEAVR